MSIMVIVAFAPALGELVQIHHTRCPTATRVTAYAHQLGSFGVFNRAAVLRAFDREDTPHSVTWAPCVAQLPDTGNGKREELTPPDLPRRFVSGNEGRSLEPVTELDTPNGTIALYLTTTGGWMVVYSSDDSANHEVTDYGTDEQGARNRLCSSVG